MISWNWLSAPAVLASLIWQQYLTHTVPFCLVELFVVYVGTGYYLKIEIAHDPNHQLAISEWIFWVLDLEPALLVLVFLLSVLSFY